MKKLIERLRTEESIRQLKSALGSYLRAAIAAVGALLLAGINDPSQVTISALLAGILGPLIKALDPSSDEYGIGAKVQAAIKSGEKEKPAELDTFHDEIATDPNDQP